MSQLQSELYDIFSYAFQMLKKPAAQESRVKISEEVIKFLELLKNQLIEPKIQHHNFTRDFFSWLALQVFSVTLDKELQSTSDLIVETFLQILEIHSPYDPLILTELLNIFIESISETLRNSYYKLTVGPLFSVKYFDVGHMQPEYDDSKAIGVDSCDGIQPAYEFFVTVVHRCAHVITQMDRAYTFEILDIVAKMFESCHCDLRVNVLTLIPKLIITQQPSSFWEWDVIYSSLYLYYRQLHLSQLSILSHFESLLCIIEHILFRSCGFNQSLAELMFVLCIEVPYCLSLSRTLTLIPDWVKLSTQLLDHLDLEQRDFDSFILKLISPCRREFLPLIESYLVKVLERFKKFNHNGDEDPDTLQNQTSELVIVEQICPAWKLCLNVIDKVSTMGYSSNYFEKILEYAAQIVSMGQRISYILRFKNQHHKFELLGSKCLRPLSAVPYMCNECLSDFCPVKYESLVRYITATLHLLAVIEAPKLDDNYLIEHVFVIFTLPWNQLQYSQEWLSNVRLACLDGILNLLYVMPPEKSKKYVAVLTSTIHVGVAADDNKSVLRKFLAMLILLLFRVSQEIVYEICNILKIYLVPDKLENLVFNEHLDYKFLCFISNTCVVRRGPDFWQIVCRECDSVGNSQLPCFGFDRFSKYVILKFLEMMQSQSVEQREVAKCFLRYSTHSQTLRSPTAITSFFSLMLKSPLEDSTVVINEIIHRFAYRSEGEIDREVVETIYGILCSTMKRTKCVVVDRLQILTSVLEITKKMLRIPFPCEMSVFKILMVYYLSSGIDVCGVRALFNIALSCRGKDFNSFCKGNEAKLAKFIVDFMLFRSHAEGTTITSSFTEIMCVLGYKTDSAMIGTELISLVLSEIIKICNLNQSHFIISELATLFLTDKKTLIEKHYENVFSDIYSLDYENIASKNIAPLFEICAISLENSMYWKYSQLVCKLILDSKHPLKIFRFLFQHRENACSEDVENQLNVLKQHFIGCLTVIESTLISSSSASLNTAKKYIRCISNFIKILGFQIVTSIQVKLLTTLRTCLPFFYDTLPKHCLITWVHFCFSVDVKKIGPYLSTILIHVLPMLEKFPDVISNVFYYFIVEHGEHFRDQLPQLYFVPCYPNLKMQQVWCVIQTSLLGKGNCNRDILATLENIYCESTETKLIALQHLRIALNNHASSLIKSLETSENVHQIFEMILTCLLDNINHKNSDVKTLCGSCLGELGAIDPTKLGFNDVHKSYTSQKYNLSADDFSVLCITKIVHCMGKYEDSKTTGILYSTIQELLRLQLLKKNEVEKFKYFAKFSTQDQYVLQPLLQTKYIFKGIKMDRNSSNPISFGYHTVKTPCEWATIWAAQMLARMPSSFEKDVFTTCLPAMRIDMEVTETVLPYILLYALLSCESSDLDLIEKEMKYILQWDLSKHRTKPDNLMIIVGESTGGVIHSDVSQTKYVAIILDLVDFVNQTVSDCYFFKATLGIPNEDQLEAKLKSFVNRFSPCAMSWKSFMQKDHCRSLYYIEKSCVDKKGLDNLKPLRNIYSKLNDIDGLVGVAKSSKVAPSTEETMVNHMVYGSIQDALSGYERLCSKYESTNTYRGLIQGYVNINQSSTALAISSQIINSEVYLKPDIFSEHIEALWNSYHYEETDEIFGELDSDFLNSHSWSVDIVGILRLLTKPAFDDVVAKIKSIRLGVVNSLCDLNRNGMNLYRQGYWYLVKLHILNDIETFSQIMFTIPPKGGKHKGFQDVWDYFDCRLTLLPKHGPYIQDVRNSHLQTLDIVFNASKLKFADEEKTKFSSHLGMMWLDSAKRARKKRCLQDAYTCIGIAEKYQPPKLFLELAKYYQAKFETDNAVLVLEQELNQNPKLICAESKSEFCRIYAKAKLLTASFNVGSMNLDFNDGYSAFKEAAEICNMEKSFVCLASYLYQQHLTETEPDNTTAKRFIQLDSARNFSKSLLYGTKHIYQSMPCILSLWLDYGARNALKMGSTSRKSDDSGMIRTLKDFNNLMENNLLCLPTYMFMTAFSQILSRINHRQSSCFDILKLIICQIIQNYHHQAMWSFISVYRSNNSMQKKRTEEIIKKIKSSNKELSKFFKVFNDFTSKLIEIAQKKYKVYQKQVDLSQLSENLRPLIVGYRHVPIMLPLQKLLTVHLSSGVSSEEQHTPFPLAPVYITDVKQSVMVLFSVQMPKRLEFVGSDGEVYPIMCKTDDLRLDSRLMEFNSIINLLLRTDSVAQEKDLSIRTYSVVPLNAECGLIEWLSGLLPLKGIITDMYTKLGVSPMPLSQIKKLMLVGKDEVELPERLRRFVQVILPNFPPVLHKWFFEMHPSPDAWYHCKNTFVKSAAVISMVGYIVGLGDRHGENILIDSKTGETVHVDFNCLFNRSDFLTYPETVPFRLTHSMVRAMGATGVEGLFVKSCEATNRVMRHNSEQLLSVMKPFRYDVKKNSQKDNQNDDQSNEEAKVNIQNIELRLNGVVRSKSDQFAPHRNSKPLSVEGQTSMLIKEATSNLNLCQMFAGWAPYL
uniref:Serine/threonine-protein kinase ATR n=3 Tax=Lygus hesperus TaxID=30085 RepID=A0A146L1C6_LYGHE